MEKRWRQRLHGKTFGQHHALATAVQISATIRDHGILRASEISRERAAALPEQRNRESSVGSAISALDQSRVRTAQFDRYEGRSGGILFASRIPRMYATSFPFQIYQFPNRVLFVFEGGVTAQGAWSTGRP